MENRTRNNNRSGGNPFTPGTLLHLWAGICLLLIAGCASFANQKLAENLSDAMLNQNDPETVRAGAPAYLLLIDSVIRDNPKDRDLLISGARLYSAYAIGLVNDSERKKRLTDKALDYATRALCLDHPQTCKARHQPYKEFSAALSQMDNPEDLSALFAFGAAWAGWIQAHSDDWNAIAQLPKVEAIFQHVVDRYPAFENGRTQLYLAIIRTQLSPAQGGKPEVGRYHFERAISYSEGRDLMMKVEFARRYARLVFDRELHDRLLNEVIAADPNQPGLTLSNTLAQKQARVLLAEEYF